MEAGYQSSKIIGVCRHYMEECGNQSDFCKRCGTQQLRDKMDEENEKTVGIKCKKCPMTQKKKKETENN
jgi:ribosomal protein L40E